MPLPDPRLPDFLALLAAGALASLLVRSGSWPARVLAVFAMLALVAAALVPPLPRSEAVAPEVVLAATADAPAAGLVVDGVREVVAGPRLPAALARAAVRAGPRAEELLVVWNGPGEVGSVAAPVGGAFYTVPPLPFDPERIRIGLQGPPAVGRPAGLEVAIEGLTEAMSARLAIVHGGNELLAREILVPVVGAATVDFVPAAAGTHEVDLRLEAAGHRIERAGTFTVAAPAQVLVLDRSGMAAAALGAQGIDVVTDSARLREPGSLAAVVVGDALPAAVQEALADAVDLGLGLCVFGAGIQGDGEPLRALLPIHVLPQAGGPSGGEGRPQPEAAPPGPPAKPEAPERPPAGATGDATPLPGGPAEVDKRSVAMVLVIDRSGSMGEVLPGGATKMSYAKTSARQTAAALSEGDEVGLVTFGARDQGRIELPLTPATDRATVERGVAALAHANEATFLAPGLRLADAMLARSNAAVRHIVVLTDGLFFDPEIVVRSQAHEMRTQRGITMSLIAILDQTTPPDFKRLSEFLARDGGGVFLPVTDASRVPRLVSAEVTRSLDKVGRKPREDAPPAEPAPPPEPDPPEPEPVPAQPDPPAAPRRILVRAVAQSPLLEPAPQPDWPTLGGVIRAAANPESHVLLVAGDEGMPLLSYANRGLGRVAALATDLAGADAEELRREPAFPARLAQWVAALARPLPLRASAVALHGTVEPPAPSADELARLGALAGREPEPLARLQPPPARQRIEHESAVPGAALAALAVLLLLALVEWACVRRPA